MRRQILLTVASCLAFGCLVAGAPAGRALPQAAAGTHIHDAYLMDVSGTSSSDVWMVGSSPSGSLAEHWDGTSLERVSSPNPPQAAGEMTSVSAASPDDAWMVGLSASDTRVFTTLAEHWDGHTWRIVPSPSPGGTQSGDFSTMLSVATLGPTDAWAVGEYLAQDGGEHAFIQHWDGKTWRRVHCPSPGHEQVLYGVSAVSPTDIWAVGRWTGDRGHSLLIHWDGERWVYVKTPYLPKGSFRLVDISAASTNDVWAVGSRAGNGDASKSLTEHWDGTRWTVIPSPNTDEQYSTNSLYGVSALSATDARAVGNDLWLHWDGASWSRVAANPFEELEAVDIITPDDAWAVGTYNGASDLADHWDGTSWTRF